MGTDFESLDQGGANCVHGYIWLVLCLSRVMAYGIETGSSAENSRFFAARRSGSFYSRAVFVIVSWSDGRTDGRKRFWSQLSN